MNEITITTDMQKINFYNLPQNITQVRLSELRDIILNPNLRKRYEQFSTFFKKFEEYSKSAATNESEHMIINTKLAINNPNIGIKWGDMMAKPCFLPKNGPYKTQAKLIDSVLSQEKRMKQVIDTYNQAIKIKWRPDGSRSRPLTADPKNSIFSL